MLRLIDVALIILLGFISISRLKTEYVDLPSGGNAGMSLEKSHESTVRIYRNQFEIIDFNHKSRYRSTQELEQALIQQTQRYGKEKVKLVVTIEARSGIMQSLIDVLDICQRNNIEKNLDYDKIF